MKNFILCLFYLSFVLSSEESKFSLLKKEVYKFRNTCLKNFSLKELRTLKIEKNKRKRKRKKNQFKKK